MQGVTALSRASGTAPELPVPLGGLRMLWQQDSLQGVAFFFEVYIRC